MTTFLGMLSGMCFTLAAVVAGGFHYPPGFIILIPTPPGLIFIVPAIACAALSFANAK